MNKKIVVVFSISTLILLLIIFLYNKEPSGVAKPEPKFSVYMEKCKFDGSKEGVFSFLFNISFENKTRLPAQFILKTKDVYVYNYNITVEHDLDRIYQPNETTNVSFVINNVYKDYMYLPNENFNVELFYCEFTEYQKTHLKMPLHEALDRYCLSIFDYAEFYKVSYIHVVVQHPGEQCSVIIRDVEGNIKVIEK
jgi:hypothetical protein